MRRKIDGSRIKRTVQARQRTGKRVTFYLSTELYKAFKAHCGRLKPSQVVDELMTEFIASTPGPYRSKFKKLIE